MCDFVSINGMRGWGRCDPCAPGHTFDSSIALRYPWCSSAASCGISLLQAKCSHVNNDKANRQNVSQPWLRHANSAHYYKHKGCMNQTAALHKMIYFTCSRDKVYSIDVKALKSLLLSWKLKVSADDSLSDRSASCNALQELHGGTRCQTITVHKIYEP